jgi:hypothetical protein
MQMGLSQSFEYFCPQVLCLDLKSIKVIRSSRDNEELSVLKILLKNALVLDEITITCSKHFAMDLKKQKNFYEQLIKLPKGSQNCKIFLKCFP